VEAALRARFYEDDGVVLLIADQWTALHRVPETTGAKALASAVIAEAWGSALLTIRPLPSGKHSKTARQQYRRALSARREALEWFGRDSVAPFSFLFVCHHLGLSPGRIREALTDTLNGRDHAPQVPTAGSSSHACCYDQWASPSLARHGT
jgi:hypothetical protein